MPPRRSMRIILRICRKRRLRSADVANTLPWEPAASTAMEATSTMMSAGRSAKAAGPAPRPRSGSGGVGGPTAVPVPRGRTGHRPGARRARCPPRPARAPLPPRPRRPPAMTTLSGAKAGASPPGARGHGPGASCSPAGAPPPPGLTDHAERLPGELEPAPPAAVATAAARRPDAHEVLHAEHHDGHDLLQGGGS